MKTGEKAIKKENQNKKKYFKNLENNFFVPERKFYYIQIKNFYHSSVMNNKNFYFNKNFLF